MSFIQPEKLDEREKNSFEQRKNTLDFNKIFFQRKKKWLTFKETE